jgi:hypothetical protein
MTIATKVVALLAAMTKQDVEGLAPAERQRLVSLCRHVAALAERAPSLSQSGVLSELDAGRRPE